MVGEHLVGLRLKDLGDHEVVDVGEELVAVVRGERRASALVRFLQWLPFLGSVADLVAKRRERSFAVLLTDKRLRLLRLQGPFFAEKITEVHDHDLADIRELVVQPRPRWSMMRLALSNGETHELGIRSKEVAVAFIEEYRLLREGDAAAMSPGGERCVRFGEAFYAETDGEGAAHRAGNPPASMNGSASDARSGLDIASSVTGIAAIATACLAPLSWLLSAAALITGILAQRRAAAAGAQGHVLSKLGIVMAIVALVASIVLLVTVIIFSESPVVTEE